MHLSNRLLMLSCIFFLFVSIPLLGRSGSRVNISTSVAVENQVVLKAGETADIVDSDEMAPAVILLFRLQEIQAQIESHPASDADTLSAALFELSIKIREKFDTDLFIAFNDLSPEHKKAYLKIAELVNDLDRKLASSSPLSISPEAVVI